MNVIYKDSNIQREQEYPCIDISMPVPGLNKIKINGIFQDLPKNHPNLIKFYYIQENKPENTNPDKFDLVQLPDVLTTQKHSEYKHLFICNRNYELVEKPQTEIIERLNSELGNYLDSEYPISLRDKHARELLLIDVNSVIKADRKQYLLALNDWLNNCRKIRDQRESDYLQNDIFPKFGEYPEKPKY